MNRERLLTFLTAFIAVVIAIGASELLVRVFSPAWLDQRMAILNPESFGSDREWKVVYSGEKFVSYEPNTSFTVSHYEYNHVANIDAWGGRVVSRNPVLAHNNRLVPVLGDSFTFGVGVSDLQTFVSKLAAANADFEFLNLGVPGSAFPQQLDILEMRHAELFQPTSYIFFYFLGNDFADILSHAEPKQTSNNKKRWKFSNLAKKINTFVYTNPILKRSYLLQFVRKFAMDLGNLTGIYQQPLHPVFDIMDVGDEGYKARAAAVLESQIARLESLEKKYGFSSMVVAIPHVYQVNDSERNETAREYGISAGSLDVLRPNRVLENITAKHQIHFFDATHCIRNAGKRQQLYYTQDKHFTPAGHASLFSCVQEPVRDFLNR